MYGVPDKNEATPTINLPEPEAPAFTREAAPIPDDVLPDAQPAEVGWDVTLQDSKDVQGGSIRPVAPAALPSENKRRNIWGDSISLLDDDDSFLDEFFPSNDLECYNPMNVPEGFGCTSTLRTLCNYLLYLC